MNTKISATILGHVSIQEMLKSTSNSRYSNEVGNVKNSWQLTSMAVFSVPLQVCRSSNMCRLISLCLTLTIAKSLQSCPTLSNPIDGSPPGSPIPGFSRQEHWSGLPFPSPMHEREKWKWSRSVVSDSSRPHGLQPTRLLCPWDFPGKSTAVGCHCLLQPSLLLNYYFGFCSSFRGILHYLSTNFWMFHYLCSTFSPSKATNYTGFGFWLYKLESWLCHI